MDVLLASMAAQRRLIMPVEEMRPEELRPEELRPENVEETFPTRYTAITHALRKAFNKEELELLADDVGIDLEDVGGSGLLDICKRLVDYAARRNRLRQLMEAAGKHRPPPEQWMELL